ncbi:hypothetical protein GDO86_001988 [Hymenochirus boettgeri]|uniref:Uncharacterized protein n=1 Tax=Hymenochirus boettgeri TaxID=247094 RepID=A0A8T2KGS7_9PIPI|nr:hypothetical protein GDO86_017955 [Hymenochirus boettgeri]KAG8456008.1 hypothetical protein GDO86_001988 [Hymenochirus boettgeri]
MRVSYPLAPQDIRVAVRSVHFALHSHMMLHSGVFLGPSPCCLDCSGWSQRMVLPTPWALLFHTLAPPCLARVYGQSQMLGICYSRCTM